MRRALVGLKFSPMGRNETGLSLLNWARESVERGAGEILLTSMDRDGTKDGFDIEMLQMISREITVPLIASGGAGSSKDMADGALLGNANGLFSCIHISFWRINSERCEKRIKRSWSYCERRLTSFPIP